MITISNLTKSFGDFDAVKSVSLSVPEGSFLVLVGPSGCGKSTMLRMLAGLEKPTGGTIAFGDKTVSDGERGWTIEPAQRDAGLVFQSYALWPHMTVAANVEWPLKVARMLPAERKARVTEVLSLLGIEKLSHRYPNEISGGQQQRVAIARMIAPKPRILLFDEPLSNLDAKLRVEMRTELLRVHRATGATSIYVTHDQVEAMTMASHVAVLKDGEVEQFGAPEDLVSRPGTAFVATFVGTPPANLVPVAPAGSGVTMAGRAMEATFPLERPAQAMFRPEDLTVSDTAGPRTIAMEFAEASPVAGRMMVTGTRDDLRLTAVVDSAPRFAPGDPVHFTLPETPAALFTPEGERLS
ncbi:ABC transporter ATP-binding protein [Pelagibacterium halotolerans]|uniref:Putrescine transport ATP-binding protein PotA n=1 Tax=Pelagibacterium halotolerans (strain DSM 22347 / JCM 15775 / CGMCC 1.7692 / B2) TaxID=1082931 RepID=G4RD48_PELHB|nr:ABC transporter ATP-binding protein [Pelagibacterium halotolerans]AEQ53798.1 putrescine transport ATP-binding protein PotA [Pelagibacterium halotolerans B2]QJR20045.1 ABC transporter ATP-binding protein [Pelagibacterium halotolerans]SEA81228.1 carbohydrate ABC transporter ATP-binding protein, CUT1 family [Pelagibacterium halotolerans]